MKNKWGVWILHDGTKQPIPDCIPVCVAMLDGDIDDEELSHQWDWVWLGGWDGDITMYRLPAYYSATPKVRELEKQS